MRSYTAIVERCPNVRLYVGYVRGCPGAHSQGETLEELSENLREVIAMLLDDGEPVLDSEYVGTQIVAAVPTGTGGGTSGSRSSRPIRTRRSSSRWTTRTR